MEQKQQDMEKDSLKKDLETKQKEAGKAFSECMFSQYKYCLIGVAIGMPFSLRQKNYWPFIFGAAIGTAIDFTEALTKTCKPLLADYNQCTKEFENFMKNESQSNN
mmetsp:Transcript_38186/g.48671  ORF Transcript_38186/g.48671 Transcript_38186/m.48671 type:complete len:106 (+) Transcript_38186:6-323(+)